MSELIKVFGKEEAYTLQLSTVLTSLLCDACASLPTLEAVSALGSTHTFGLFRTACGTLPICVHTALFRRS